MPEGSVVPVKNGEMNNNMLKPMLQLTCLVFLPMFFFVNNDSIIFLFCT